ncbi:MAG: chaperone NapD [Sulfurospirillaceae bacterium]|nr:chaperone NapD [Sulfurospirillaceae bacterium]MCK9546637.1 chaperone NapD [Sulfurospirillaceae bacterium]MDY0237701.1 chaperone NapD [Campylobacterales bacterium]NLM99841.1 chaperone NapD [Campylobacteraceae bacterium]
MNISSIVVQASSEHVEELVELFKKCDFCDYHFHDKKIGKIIVTVEGESVSDEIRHLKKIQTTPRVISADMMMSYSEDELDKERAHLENKDPVPQMLLDDDLRAEKITYYGDIKKKDI